MVLNRVFTISMLFSLLLVGFTSCNSKISDADIKAKVEQAINVYPDVFVDVKDAVVTLTGNVENEEERVNIEKSANAAEPNGIKSIINNLMVMPSIAINTDDVDLSAKVTDATKDFPTIRTSVANGVITVTGEIAQDRVQTLKMSLDALNPQKVDMSGITVK